MKIFSMHSYFILFGSSGKSKHIPFRQKRIITKCMAIFFVYILSDFSSSSYSFAYAAPQDEIFYVMEPFDSISDEWFVRRYNDEGNLNLIVLTSHDSGEEENIFRDTPLFGNGALRIEYEVAQTERWGGFVDFGWILNSTGAAHNCHGATHLSIWYKVLESQSNPDRVHLRLIMMDDSDCLDGYECADSYGKNLENYYSSHYILGGSSDIDEGDNEWREIRVELRGNGNSDSPLLLNNTGPIGNGNLDSERLRGWRVELSIDSHGDIGSVSEGVVLLDQLACVGGEDLIGAAFHPAITNFDNSDQDSLFERSLAKGAWNDRYYQSDRSRNLSEVLLTSNGILSINYTIEQAENWGGFMDFQHLAPGNAYYNLSQSTHISMKHNVSKHASSEFRAHLRLILMDGSNCTINCYMYPGQNLENYYSFNYVLDDDSLDPWSNNITLALKSGAQSSRSCETESYFSRPGWTGIVGNDVLDRTYVKGFRIELNVDSQGVIGSMVSGAIALKDLRATSQYNYSKSAPHCVQEYDLEFNNIKRLSDFRKIEFIADRCHKTCEANANCVYAFSNELDCYMASYLHPSSVGLLNTERKQSKFSSYWMDDISKRGDFCILCACHESNRTIDCRGRDLTIIPKTFSQQWVPYILDLRNNTRLCLIGSGAFSAISSNLKELRLPKSMRHISNQTINDLKALKIVSFEGTNGEHKINNVISSSSGFFGDICCEPGAHLDLTLPSDGLTFCNMKVDTPGIDSYMDPFWQYIGGDRISEIKPSSSFMTEAAESPEKCAEYCAITEECNYFSYDARRRNSEHICNLLRSNGTSYFACCDEDDYGDDEKSIPGWTSGRPPRTRHIIDNARVLVNPQTIKLDSSNKYMKQFTISLGSMPLRGGVWIEPKVVSDTDFLPIAISPKRIVLYDNRTVATVTVQASKRHVPLTDKTIVLLNVVDSCDKAFMLSNSLTAETNVYINIGAPSGTNYLLVIILVPICGILILAFTWIYVEYKKRMADSAWSVKLSDLKFDEPPEIIGRGKFGLVLLAEYRGTQVAVKRVIPPENHKRGTSIMDRAITDHGDLYSSGSSPGSTIFENLNSDSSNDGVLAKAKNNRNGYSKIIVNSSGYGYSQNDFIREMRLLSKLRHPCITTIMGAIIDRKEEPMLLMEYMDHGSLYDVIHNETMILEGEHVLPILRDISRGLRFLHAIEPRVIHGDLKAQNILVDCRFRAKVADFGLSKNKQIGGTGTPFWMAPELLREESQNTTASDVYSFGILLYEVYSRREPYEGEDVKILHDIADPSVSKRPPIPPACPQDIQFLMTLCLRDDPSMRPTFEDIDIKLNKFDVSDVEPRKLRISMQKAKKEKELTDSLLYNVFPQHIAIALRDGKKVEPEARQIVTIFFSDIVGFTDISSSLSAIKVSDMLDRLYNKFDALSLEHDVFKVETIGDAYMAATNLVKDQINHTSRVAQFSIAALDAAKATLIDVDNPELGFVNIRVGFHSGPVVANVVGSRNPRYCLFGDTVNTASRMESNSEKNRIHCSERSAKLLRSQNPNIRLLPRGKIQVKGKGEMATYWVNEGSSSRRMIWINQHSSRRLIATKRESL